MYQVMVVDDEPMAASLIVNIIKRKYSDFEIMGTAYDGEEALELMEEKGEPDVLITDIQMPVMNGLKLVEETKKRYPEVISVCHCQWISGIRICKTGYRIWGVRLYPETDRALGIFQTDYQNRGKAEAEIL